ncbi:unnamed protein product [Lymnaea stagnalis]|uniref:Uncharacterized protein n=1 Tax=Lymnaea stagnalis TaxID=6523 RepID=A0AAV2GY21_LYMST
MADGDKILQNFQKELQHAQSIDKQLPTLARQGNDKFVQDFLGDNVKIQSSGITASVSQLYVASFWGLKDTVRQLLEAGTNPNHQNEGTLWTPLHAAAFQEHGPVVMLLLEYGAQPEVPDSENRTPADFASASDTVWPLFAALGVVRTQRNVLIDKQILRPGSGVTQTRESGFGMTMAGYNSGSEGDGQKHNYLAAMSGDVLANEHEERGPVDPRQVTQPNFSMWK